MDVTGWRADRPIGIGGRREKLRVWNEETREAFIFKEPAVGTGEHWMEKGASEIGQILGLRIVEVELARRGTTLGVLIREFGGFPREAGIDLLAERTRGYETAIHHTYQRIRDVLYPLGQMPAFHRMLVLDALIDNIDRHDENWELVGRERLTPIYDNGNCEIVHIPPSEQERLLTDPARREARFGRVISAIAWEEEPDEPYFVTPLVLLDALRDTYPDEFRVAVLPFLDVPVRTLQNVFQQIPDEFIHPHCRELAKVMIEDRMARLRELAR